ncbi:MAG: Peptidase family [Bacteroidetes bacterium]|jgi:hypothetical protein|nr:Peptidase family [Bacteroidota bacterium]
MKLLLSLLIFLLIICKTSFSQSLSYQFPEKFNQVYNFKPDEAFAILNKEPLKGLTKEQSDKFRINNIYNTQYEFDNNQIYLDWGQAEVYLMRLLDTIIPDTLTKKKNLNVFITRDPVNNAYTKNNGFLFINIGLLANVRSEAILAYVIGHESGHYIFDHQYKGLKKFYEAYYSKNFVLADEYFAFKRKQEADADYFAMQCSGKLGFNLKETAQDYEMNDMKRRLYRYSRGYANMVKASQKTEEAIDRQKSKTNSSSSSHPDDVARMELANKMQLIYKGSKKYLLDSLFFTRLRKTAREECKKIYFDNARYEECLSIAFVDYLYDSKNLKNVYYIYESLRRLMYIKPKLKTMGFLLDGIEDDELFYANKSLLYKPDYLFFDVLEYEELKNHSFFTVEKKPFNTYEQAFHYFSREALKYNMNEANFSIGLHYYGQKNNDSVAKYLNKYIENGSGLNITFAGNLLKNKSPYIEGNKWIVIYDNSGNYTGSSYNYYQARNKKSVNPIIRKELLQDTLNTDLVFINELIGTQPKLLAQMQKLESNLFKLYDEDDVSNFKKVKLKTKENIEELALSHPFNKHFLILAPEFYNWFAENKYSTLFLVEVVHQYQDFLGGKEEYNTYTGYYQEINGKRPYFKDAIRNAFLRKQTDQEIVSDLNKFLYVTE